MSRIPETAIKRTFIDLIGFTRVIELNADFISRFEFDVMHGATRVMISPDVNSLHIFVREPDGSIWQQTVDYPYSDDYVTLEEWITDNWLESYEGQVEWAEGIAEAATQDNFYRWSDLGDYLSYGQVEVKYREMKAAFDLVALLEPS